MLIGKSYDMYAGSLLEFDLLVGCHLNMAQHAKGLTGGMFAPMLVATLYPTSSRQV